MHVGIVRGFLWRQWRGKQATKLYQAIMSEIHKAMGWGKKDVTLLLTHWSYVFLAITHRCGLSWQRNMRSRSDILVNPREMHFHTLQLSWSLASIIKSPWFMWCYGTIMAFDLVVHILLILHFNRERGRHRMSHTDVNCVTIIVLKQVNLRPRYSNGAWSLGPEAV